MKHRAVAVGVGLFLLAAAAYSDVRIGLVPPFIEKVVRPGSKINDTISFTNQGSDPVSVSIEIADFDVNQQGSVVEEPPGTRPTSLAPYLRVSPARAPVGAGQQVFFRYSVQAPKGFKQLRAMIYFLCRPQPSSGGGNQVLLAPRLGIPLYVENISARPANLRVDGIQWQRSGDKKDSLELNLTVDNEGDRNIRPTGTLDVRSADGRFEKVFPFNEGKEPVLPGLTRRWQASFGPVPGGELSLEFRFATSAGRTQDFEARIPAAGD